jgi:hypothetical protein
MTTSAQYDEAESLPEAPPAAAGMALGVAALTPRRLVAIIWLLLAGAAGIEAFADPFWHRTAADRLLLLQDLALLAFWAVATPVIVWSAARFPLTASPRRHGLVHLTAAAAFVVVGNLLIRVPMAPRPWPVGAEWVIGDALRGLARFGPTALVAYAVIVVAAQVAHRTATQSSVPSAPPAGDAPPLPDRVVVREWNRVRLVSPNDIDWIEADDNNIIVHTSDRTYKGRGRIGDLASQLDPRLFVRIHRSAIVRVAAVREVQPLTKGDLAVIVHDGKVLRVARGRRSLLEQALGLSV